MSPTQTAKAAVRTGFPRVSGDEPTRKTKGNVAKRFSPRERG